MNGFVCKKPILLSGRLFSCGEIIPNDDIVPERIQTLIKSGYLSQIEDELEKGETISEPDIKIPIFTDKETEEIHISKEAVTEALTILQLGTEEAVEKIEKIEEKETLILISKLSNKKIVQKAAETKKNQLEGECECPCHTHTNQTT